MFLLLIFLLTQTLHAEQLLYQNTFLNVRSSILFDTSVHRGVFLVEGFLWKREGGISINGSVFQIESKFDSLLKRNHIYVDSVRFLNYEDTMITQFLCNHLKRQNKLHGIADEIRVRVRMPLIGAKELSFSLEDNFIPDFLRDENRR